ncbi:hypothetical protein INT46_007074 [Mucor plumbeus]|uniref:NADP-dependent oxidoreductase domain-containing protein n=1 Tax=Mucor plumbeus TaxID=97098 RepID=A0A8H7RQP6_9FUNG|nr:hypothetical protein INT46_007074 [Mucor plumbeus]
MLPLKMSPPGTEHLESLMKNPIILSIAKKHHRDVSQMNLTWAVQNEVIMIPKNTNIDRMKSNFKINHIELDEDGLQKIAKLELNDVYFNGFFENTYSIDFHIFY